MTNNSRSSPYQTTYRTSMGAFFPGSHVIFRGYDLHKELSHLSWFELHLFSTTGKFYPKKHIELLQHIWVLTSYPDPRIWNNRISALAGTSRSTGSLGVSGSQAISDAYIFGRGIEIQAISFFIEAVNKIKNGSTLQECIAEEINKNKRIAGYGRPLINKDERIAPLLDKATELGLDKGPHLALSFQIEDALVRSGKNLKINYGAVATAIVADIGLTPHEYYLFMYPTFLAGMFPCYIDALNKKEGLVFPLTCNHIAYEGPSDRPWEHK